VGEAEPEPAPPSPTQEHPLDIHGLTVWVDRHEGRSVLYWDGHPGEVSTGRQVDDLIDTLAKLRPHLTD